MERKSIGVSKKRKPSGAAVIRPDLTDKLFRALFEEWARTGYVGISLERVAACAGIGKAAIYRRWASKREFASDAIASIEIAMLDPTDHGSLKADARAFLQATRTVLRHPLVRRIIADLVAERLRSGELATVLDRAAMARRQFGHGLLDRAINRHELHENLDRELALDLLFSPLYMRMIIQGKNVTRAELDRQVIAIDAGIKACCFSA
ncbi:transcriptional regulator, TetR family [Palleronia marisminoris]|uniref:Bacterial regulatory proteins, tetR family n=1 Tax=Palleronia marisminoris TaxID=315423 RepID=A0A1Y5TN50_9RHOB|nr:TetR/AcrR family transcriptional regulator [Palleronia marisminoris]SFH45460.1 transcriptional regulator, TetR family [Palleronia marisminoris]SLN67850.1 Bacterial regulatory proteins, tetR family [Palleronia marisminoris]